MLFLAAVHWSAVWSGGLEKVTKLGSVSEHILRNWKTYLFYNWMPVWSFRVIQRCRSNSSLRFVNLLYSPNDKPVKIWLKYLMYPSVFSTVAHWHTGYLITCVSDANMFLHSQVKNFFEALWKKSAASNKWDLIQSRMCALTFLCINIWTPESEGNMKCFIS